MVFAQQIVGGPSRAAGLGLDFGKHFVVQRYGYVNKCRLEVCKAWIAFLQSKALPYATAPSAPPPRHCSVVAVGYPPSTLEIKL